MPSTIARKRRKLGVNEGKGGQARKMKGKGEKSGQNVSRQIGARTLSGNADSRRVTRFHRAGSYMVEAIKKKKIREGKLLTGTQKGQNAVRGEGDASAHIRVRRD